MSMNAAQARIYDPVLSNHARGYQQPDRVGQFLFPLVDVPTRGGQVLVFGKEAFRKYNLKRAPGSSVAMVQFGYVGDKYNLDQDALDISLPRELIQEAEVPGVDLGMRAVTVGMDTSNLQLEIEHAGIAQDAARYGDDNKVSLSGSNQWTHAESRPIVDVEDAIEAIRRRTGKRPNVLVLGPNPCRALLNHPTIVAKYQNAVGGVVTLDQVAALFRLEKVVVGEAVWAPSEDDAPFNDVWGNNAVLAYAPQTPTGPEQPSYGYTYRLKGNPMVEQPRWDGAIRSWVYGCTYERKPYMTGPGAGFLFQNVAGSFAPPVTP